MSKIIFSCLYFDSKYIYGVKIGSVAYKLDLPTVIFEKPLFQDQRNPKLIFPNFRKFDCFDTFAILGLQHLRESKIRVQKCFKTKFLAVLFEKSNEETVRVIKRCTKTKESPLKRCFDGLYKQLDEFDQLKTFQEHSIIRKPSPLTTLRHSKVFN